MTDQERIDISINWLKSEYVDAWGMVVQHDGDGGDAAYRTALTVFLLFILGKEQEACELYAQLKFNCQLSPGIWIRHPDPTKWYSNPDNFSRDQMAKVELAAFIMKDDETIKGIFSRIKQRNYFHQNTHKGTDCVGTECFKTPDFVGIGEAHNYLRFLNDRLYSWILDFRFFGDLILRLNQPWDYDSLLLSDLIYSRIRCPSPVSWLASKIYKHCTDWRYRIRNYYSIHQNGIPPLAELYILAGEKFL